MPVIINGTTGVSDVDGSAATPAIRGTDANTGMFFPAADTIAFAEGGTESMRLDSASNVGIGTTSPSEKLHVVSTSNVTGIRVSGSVDNVAVNLYNSGTGGRNYGIFSTNNGSGAGGGALAFFDHTAGAYRAIIDSAGSLLMGTTSNPNGVMLRLNATNSGFSGRAIQTVTDTTGTVNAVFFSNPNGNVGNISVSTNSVGYNSTSDYRLKDNIQPMTGALAKVAELKPVTYKWKSDGSDGQGFIAHELAEVCPDAVNGEKDAVDAEGNPVYQGIDTSFLVATLTAAIQELRGIVDSQAARIAALEGAAQ
jgi:hypothetical protein